MWDPLVSHLFLFSPSSLLLAQPPPSLRTTSSASVLRRQRPPWDTAAVIHHHQLPLRSFGGHGEAEAAPIGFLTSEAVALAWRSSRASLRCGLAPRPQHRRDRHGGCRRRHPPSPAPPPAALELAAAMARPRLR